MYNTAVYIRNENMIRTQIYLTEEEQVGLKALTKSTGLSQSALIRDAVDNLIKETSVDYQNDIIDKASGIWTDHEDLPDFKSNRKSWDRD